ncbi:membrane protein ORF64 [Anguillid herpesvirus 1]|uniref:Membrane protein ORF64 n=1 Tax=Anguillid herpesvirus 1 TaxID=150286 RepID=A0A1J0RED3_9VIRU|nr:membrane protein ORF64 [Anguillid herpesvirus 1]ADA57827.1 membrane protein ORF64 [Anguillid herpesvirus 1]APD76227.1 membrane protein ORF64 [Anguillid herpesvirus 1]QRM16358.1 membrane protein ORF64 [Anguillid herpesvirus 1]QRM16487.1 membrane protein ORF64 [Anguillid herpesvirus 1]QRM16617.1 membrane protein ORF64 [Anguillid herpesvirus 1]
MSDKYQFNQGPFSLNQTLTVSWGLNGTIFQIAADPYARLAAAPPDEAAFFHNMLRSEEPRSKLQVCVAQQGSGNSATTSFFVTPLSFPFTLNLRPFNGFNAQCMADAETLEIKFNGKVLDDKQRPRLFVDWHKWLPRLGVALLILFTVVFGQNLWGALVLGFVKNRKWGLFGALVIAVTMVMWTSYGALLLNWGWAVAGQYLSNNAEMAEMAAKLFTASDVATAAAAPIVGVLKHTLPPNVN